MVVPNVAKHVMKKKPWRGTQMLVNTDAIRIGGEDIVMDPMLVFQRYLTAGRNSGYLDTLM